MPDFMDYWTHARVDVEIEAWEGQYQRQKDNYVYQKRVARLVKEFNIKSVVELCCGVGYVPQGLPKDVDYIGVDLSAYSLQHARHRNPSRTFMHYDIRTLDLPRRDLVIMFAALKHFEHEEWDDIFRKFISLGEYAAFNMNVADTDQRDNYEYPHVWVPEVRVIKLLAEAGHELLIKETWEDLPGGRRDIFYVTHRSNGTDD